MILLDDEKNGYFGVNFLCLLVESEPKCSSNVSGEVYAGDVVSFSCQVQYAGKIAPQIHWSSSIRFMTSPIIDESVAGSLVKIRGSIKLQKSDDGKTYSAETFFNAYKPKYDADATNEITYKHTWTSEPFIVRCKCSLYSGEIRIDLKL